MMDLKTPCTFFGGARTSAGYGSRWNPRTKKLDYAHRMAWEDSNGPIPAGLHVLHRCDRPACVNVDHLFLGTHADNMADMARKGRADRVGKVRGERHGSHTQPDRRPKGDRHGNMKISEAQVDELRLAHANGESTLTLAERYGVARCTVQRIAYGRARA